MPFREDSFEKIVKEESCDKFSAVCDYIDLELVNGSHGWDLSDKDKLAWIIVALHQAFFVDHRPELVDVAWNLIQRYKTKPDFMFLLLSKAVSKCKKK